VVSAVRRATRLPVIPKLSPNVADITVFARVCEESGADAVSCINTLLGLVIDVETRRPRLAFGTGGLSGPAIRPIAVRMAWQAARAVKIPVIGIGGIASASDALEFLIAGCRAVQIGTANFVDPGVYERVRAGLEEYLTRQGLDDVNRVVGTLRYPGLPVAEELGG
jgi:dihydroorotate dehydrogenase (NAD+) catalytic subunit